MRRTFSGLTLADQVANAMSKLDMVGEEQPNALEEASKTIAEECNAAWRDSEEQPRPHELRKDRIVGEGGYSCVYKVTDVRTKRMFALKQLRKGFVAALNLAERVLLEKVAHDEVHKKVAHAREKFNMACCPLLQILQLEPVRRRIFAFIPGGSSRNHLRRLARRPTNTADSMRALARCRRVCRAFRRWLNDAITSVPRVIVCGGAALGSGAQDGRRVGPQRTAESLDLISLQWSPLPPLRAKRCGAGATTLGDGRLLVVGGKSSEHLLLRSAEIYDPQSGSWSPAPDMVRAPPPTHGLI